MTRIVGAPVEPRRFPWSRRAGLRGALRTAATFLLASVSFFAAYLTRPQYAPFDVSRWLQDFWELEDHVQHQYPNLSWAIETHAVDPPRLHRYTVAAIKRAQSDEEAEKAIRVFVRAFRDQHFTLDWSDRPHHGSLEEFVRGRPGRDDGATYACRFFHFEESRKDFRLPFDEDPRFARLPGPDDFPAGILTIGDRRLGIVRIATFRTYRYSSACRRTWPEIRRHLSGPCDESCQTQLVMKTAERVLQELADRARQMQLAQVDTLILDVTGNGGGQPWSSLAAEMFVSKPLPFQRVRFSRSRGNAEPFRASIQRIRADLRFPDLDPASRDILEQSLARARSLLAETRLPCEPGDIWDSGSKPGCTNLTGTEYWMGGLLSTSPDRVPAKWRSEYDLAYPRIYPAETGLYNGPLAVLVDRGTGSAAELLAGELQDWAGTPVIGEPTAGAGGGWLNGDKPLVLHNTHLRVHIPDHATYRRDGSNANAGVMPDVCVPWSAKEKPEIRLRKLRRALKQF